MIEGGELEHVRYHGVMGDGHGLERSNGDGIRVTSIAKDSHSSPTCSLTLGLPVVPEENDKNAVFF